MIDRVLDMQHKSLLAYTRYCEINWRPRNNYYPVNSVN